MPSEERSILRRLRRELDRIVETAERIESRTGPVEELRSNVAEARRTVEELQSNRRRRFLLLELTASEIERLPARLRKGWTAIH